MLHLNYNYTLLHLPTQDEKPLQYYSHYTLLNCLMECEANVTYNHCACNMYFQVHFQSYTHVKQSF